MTILDRILLDVADELSSAKASRPIGEVRSMLPDAPPARSFPEAFSGRFRLIAEIKERSPSVGAMLEKNVASAAGDYEGSDAVGAISVLTNRTHFGMSIERLAAVRAGTAKPVLRKDFIVDEYQIREARAFGADAVLLMANVLDAARLSGFHDLARELGMEALFEVHTDGEIALLPTSAILVGINSRKFKSDSGFAGAGGHSDRDFSLEFSAFELADRLPAGCLRVAESGLSPDTIAAVKDKFHAGLVGTSLLRAPGGVGECLRAFEEAIAAA